MAEIQESAWDETAANNNQTPPAGWPEQQAPSTVNDCAREMMAVIKRWFNRVTGRTDAGALVASGGTSTAITVAYDTAPASLYTGLECSFKVTTTCGADPTLNVNSLGAKNIQKVVGTAYANLAAGDIVATQHVKVKYDGTLDKWVILQPLNTLGKHKFFVPAGAMIGATTNGGAAGQIETATNKVNYRVLDFDATTQEFACFALSMPSSWDEGTITFRPVWTFASSSGGVVWALQAVATSDDDATDVAYGTEQTSTDTALTAGDLHRGPESAAITIGGTPAANDTVMFRIKRNPSDGSDTLGADARLIGVEIYITADATVDVS